MKLSKLFLILPVFAMVACANNPVQPSEEDKSTITEEEFTAIFQDLKLFKEDNVIFSANFIEENFYMYVEAEDGVCKVYQDDTEKNEEEYVEFFGKEFDVIEYEDGTWCATSYPLSFASAYFFDRSAFIPFEFKEFKRDETNKSYVAKETRLIVETDDITCENVEIKFNEGKPTLITFSFYNTDKPENAGTFTQTFTYGNAHVVNPK